MTLSTPIRLVLAALALAAAPLAAQPAPGERLDAAARAAIVDSAAALVARNYVFADTGEMIAGHLRGRLRAGAFDAAATPAQLVDALTREMQAVNGDGHLYAVYRPAPGTPAAIILAAQREDRRGPPRPTPEQLDAVRRRNYEINRADRLEGNVGYLEVLGFAGEDDAARAIDAAMAFLGRVDAMIVDVRRAPGGSGRTAGYLASWFLPDGTPMINNEGRAMGMDIRGRAGPVAGEKRLEIPLYVLTSGGTASASEAFALSLQAPGRAKVVGETSAGAGYNNFFYPVGEEMGISVSIGRGYSALNGKMWERTGVRPDVAVPADQALAAAHADALRALAAGAPDERRKRELEWALALVDATARPVAVPAEALAAYVGTYGNRVVSVRDGRLLYSRRVDRPGEPLVALSPVEFANGAAERIEFVRDASGAVTALRIRTADGRSSDYPRATPEG